MKKEIIYFKQNHTQAVKKLYKKNRSSFLRLVKKHDPDNDSPIKMYQDAFITLREHAISGRLDNYRKPIKTYLLRIGKHIIYDLLQNKEGVKEDEITIVLKEGFDEVFIFKEPEITAEFQLLKKYFKNLGKRCQKMLTLFYYKRLSYEDIAINLGYENIDIVKNQKSHCLKSLKELIKPNEQWNKKD